MEARIEEEEVAPSEREESYIEGNGDERYPYDDEEHGPVDLDVDDERWLAERAAMGDDEDQMPLSDLLAKHEDEMPIANLRRHVQG